MELWKNAPGMQRLLTVYDKDRVSSGIDRTHV
jgi:hypothetical protein